MGQPKSKSSGLIANRVAVLVNRREGYAKKIGVREFATTHNCNSLGNSQPSIENSSHSAQRNWVVEGEDAIGTGLHIDIELYGDAFHVRKLLVRRRLQVAS